MGNNTLTYWGVGDIAAAHARLIQQGASPREPIKDVGEIGIIENPHFSVKP